MSYEDQTKEELEDELRSRDLPVSGTKSELVERLQAADGRAGRDGEGGGGGRLRPLEAARRAAAQLAELRGREVDGIAGFEPADDGWRVVVELVEMSRVPHSTDVLGEYEVTLDAEGELVTYERLGRYVRARTGEDER
ncbi:MAG: gas vesicle protein [Actinobacteria bacterium]|nr:gas vesicle protein [Actinomycetota bacterium]